MYLLFFSHPAVDGNVSLLNALFYSIATYLFFFFQKKIVSTYYFSFICTGNCDNDQWAFSITLNNLNNILFFFNQSSCKPVFFFILTGSLDHILACVWLWRMFSIKIDFWIWRLLLDFLDSSKLSRSMAANVKTFVGLIVEMHFEHVI